MVDAEHHGHSFRSIQRVAVLSPRCHRLVAGRPSLGAPDVPFSRLLRLPENAGVASMGDTKAGGPFDVSGDQARVWASACRRTRTAGPTHRQNHAGRLREKHGRSPTAAE